MSQVREDLEAAMDILDERGWCQGRAQAEDGRVCAQGAVSQAIGVAGLTITEAEANSRYVRYNTAIEALMDAIPAGTFQNCIGRPYPHSFNDLPTTTVEDVKLLFKRAIEACDE